MVKKKTKHKPGLPIGEPFAPLRFSEMDSAAYQSLTGNAAKIYGYFVRTARTVAVKLGASDEWSVVFDYTYTEAKRRGFSESTFKRATKELWQSGFISVVAIGGKTASAERGRMPNKYKLAKLWKTYGDTWTDRTLHEPDPWELKSEPSKKDKGRW